MTIEGKMTIENAKICFIANPEQIERLYNIMKKNDKLSWQIVEINVKNGWLEKANSIMAHDIKQLHKK